MLCESVDIKSRIASQGGFTSIYLVIVDAGVDFFFFFLTESGFGSFDFFFLGLQTVSSALSFSFFKMETSNGFGMVFLISIFHIKDAVKETIPVQPQLKWQLMVAQE